MGIAQTRLFPSLHMESINCVGVGSLAIGIAVNVGK
jgi:hypothetical protein